MMLPGKAFGSVIIPLSLRTHNTKPRIFAADGRAPEGPIGFAA